MRKTIVLLISVFVLHFSAKAYTVSQTDFENQSNSGLSESQPVNDDIKSEACFYNPNNGEMFIVDNFVTRSINQNYVIRWGFFDCVEREKIYLSDNSLCIWDHGSGIFNYANTIINIRLKLFSNKADNARIYLACGDIWDHGAGLF